MMGKSRKNRKIAGFAGMVLLVLLLLGGLVKLCNTLLVDDTGSYTRLTMHEFYGNKGQIDTIFLGSSHCFRAYDPLSYGEQTGASAYNLGSSSQNYDTSYYLLREAARCNDLKTVYLDLHYKFLFIGKEDRDLVQANIITDYMHWSLNKAEFLLTTSEAGDCTNRLLPFRRNLESLGDLGYLKEVWTKKHTETYRNYQSQLQGQEYYYGRGFVWSEASLNAEEITWWENFSPISEDMDSQETYSLDYIERIVNFCEREGIRLVFVTAPSLDQYLEAVGPYDQAHEYIQALADRYGVPYLDFNLCRTEYLSLTDDDYIDVDHLNGRGAEKLTAQLALMAEKLESGDRAWIDEYFYPCYDEK